MNKIGCTQWGMPGEGLYAAKVAAEAGLDGVQIELGSRKNGYPLAQQVIYESYMEDAAKYGIEYPSLAINDITEHDFSSGIDSSAGKEALEQMKLGIEIAAKMKIRTVMIPDFFCGLLKKSDEQRKNVVRTFRYCCDIAKEHNIMIASEASVSWEEHKAIFDAVARRNLGVFYDSMNYKFFAGLDGVEVLTEAYESIREVGQIHVKDGVNEISESLLGEGEMDFFETMNYLKESGYGGWIILENYYSRGALKQRNILNQIELLKHDIDTVKRTLLVT